jgi:hypothetical protein
MDLLQDDLEAAVHERVNLFGSMFSANDVEPATSANSTVTCSALAFELLRVVRIRSARCGGVYVRGSARDRTLVIERGAARVAESLRRRALAPARGHARLRSSRAPQPPQKRASSRFE